MYWDQRQLRRYALFFEQEILSRTKRWPAEYESALRAAASVTADQLLAGSFPPRPAPYHAGPLDLVVWPMICLGRGVACTEEISEKASEELRNRYQIVREQMRVFYAALVPSPLSNHLSICSSLLIYLGEALKRSREMLSGDYPLLSFEPLYYSMPWDTLYDIVFCVNSYGDIWQDNRFSDLLSNSLNQATLSEVNEMFSLGRTEKVTEWFDDLAMEKVARIVAALQS